MKIAVSDEVTALRRSPPLWGGGARDEAMLQADPGRPGTLTSARDAADQPTPACCGVASGSAGATVCRSASVTWWRS